MRACDVGEIYRRYRNNAVIIDWPFQDSISAKARSTMRNDRNQRRENPAAKLLIGTPAGVSFHTSSREMRFFPLPYIGLRREEQVAETTENAEYARSLSSLASNIHPRNRSSGICTIIGRRGDLGLRAIPFRRAKAYSREFAFYRAQKLSPELCVSSRQY